MTKEAVCVGVDVAKNSLDMAVSNSEGVRQFANDHEGVTNAVWYIAGLKPARVIIEATGRLEMPFGSSSRPPAGSCYQPSPGARLRPRNRYSG
ncbi:hypothetical protein ACFLXG_02185 [Chloroflexota bacterium]